MTAPIKPGKLTFSVEAAELRSMVLDQCIAEVEAIHKSYAEQTTEAAAGGNAIDLALARARSEAAYLCLYRLLGLKEKS